MPSPWSVTEPSEPRSVASATVAPPVARSLSKASRARTVIVDGPVEPSDMIASGLAPIVLCAASAAAGATVIAPFEPPIVPSPAETVRVPAVRSVTVKPWLPASAPV